MPAFAVDPSGRRVYPEWLFSFVVLHRRGTLGTFLKGIHCGRCPSSPSRMFGSPPVPWQIGLPQDQVHICCIGGLGRTCIPPSFHPHSMAWRNISCNTTDQWGVPRPHQGYSSRKSSRSTHLSDSQTEIPASLALS